jgi:ureidoacrylate peracid hydrolase
MHTINIPRRTIDRVIAARGREHVFDNVNPAKTALLVIDLQNAFMMEGVAPSPVPMAREIVPNVNRLAEAVRKTGGKVVWIKHTIDPDTADEWSVFHDDLSVPEFKEARHSSMRQGTVGHDLWAELVVEPGDLTINKTRFSAFIQGSSDLETLLRQRAIDSVIVTGTITGTCCESTARDAMMRNFKVIMVSDACAARSDEEHNAALIAVYTKFGDLMSTDQLIGCLRRNATILESRRHAATAP